MKQQSFWPKLGVVLLSAICVVCFTPEANAVNEETIVIDGSTGVRPLVVALTDRYKAQDNTAVAFEVGDGLNPAHRIKALANGDIDIAMASHGIDIDKITELGLVVHLFAKVAVVIGVNKSTPITTISYQNLCDIYGGKSTHWENLSSNTGVITPLIRPHSEVDTEVVMKHIPCFSSLHIPPTVREFEKSGQMARALAQTPGTIGITTMVRVSQSHGKISPLALNGVAPSVDNVLNGSYSLTRNMYLITRAIPTEIVTDFLAFLASDEGKQVIIENNAVPND